MIEKVLWADLCFVLKKKRSSEAFIYANLQQPSSEMDELDRAALCDSQPLKSQYLWSNTMGKLVC